MCACRGERDVREAKYRAYNGELREILTASIGKQSQTHWENCVFKQKVLQQRENLGFRRGNAAVAG